MDFTIVVILAETAVLANVVNRGFVGVRQPYIKRIPGRGKVAKFSRVYVRLSNRHAVRQCPVATESLPGCRKRRRAPLSHPARPVVALSIGPSAGPPAPMVVGTVIQVTPPSPTTWSASSVPNSRLECGPAQPLISSNLRRLFSAWVHMVHLKDGIRAENLTRKKQQFSLQSVLECGPLWTTRIRQTGHPTGCIPQFFTPIRVSGSNRKGRPANRLPASPHRMWTGMWTAPRREASDRHDRPMTAVELRARKGVGPVLVGVDAALTSRCAQNFTFEEFFESFCPRAANDLDHFFRRIVEVALTFFKKHSIVIDSDYVRPGVRATLQAV